jgi:hypothetical protein
MFTHVLVVITQLMTYGNRKHTARLDELQFIEFISCEQKSIWPVNNGLLKMLKWSTISANAYMSLLLQDFLNHWKTSSMFHTVTPPASTAFHSSFCHTTGHKLCSCSSDNPTSRSWQESEWVLMKVTQLAYFILSINLGSGCPWHHKKNGQKPHNAVPKLQAALPTICCPVVVITIQKV